MKVLMFLSMSLFYFSPAYAATFSAATQEACMQILCDEDCQNDHILYAAAERQCLESEDAVTIRCDEFSLETTLNGTRSLSGLDSANNPVDCWFEKSEDGKDLYTCESYQGSPYAELKISTADVVVSEGSFAINVDFKDTTTDDEGSFSKLTCTVDLAL